jgi:hypothetical protein
VVKSTCKTPPIKISIIMGIIMIKAWTFAEIGLDLDLSSAIVL